MKQNIDQHETVRNTFLGQIFLPIRVFEIILEKKETITTFI